MSHNSHPWHDIDWQSLSHINHRTAEIPYALDVLYDTKSRLSSDYRRAGDVLLNYNYDESSDMDTLPLLMPYVFDRLQHGNEVIRVNLLRLLVELLDALRDGFMSMGIHAPLLLNIGQMYRLLHEQCIIFDRLMLHKETIRSATTVLARLSAYTSTVVPVLTRHFHNLPEGHERGFILESLASMIQDYTSRFRTLDKQNSEMMAALRWLAGQALADIPLDADGGRFRRRRANEAMMLYLLCSPDAIPDTLIPALSDALSNNAPFSVNDLTRAMRTLPPLQVVEILEATGRNMEVFVKYLWAYLQGLHLLIPRMRYQLLRHTCTVSIPPPQSSRALYATSQFSEQSIRGLTVIAHADRYWKLESNLVSAIWNLPDDRDAVFERLARAERQQDGASSASPFSTQR